MRPHGCPDRSYAVIDAAYAGPHHNVVERTAQSYLEAGWMADATQAIVVAIDARGTLRRGRDWERALYKNLGAVPLAGHVLALQSLAAKYPQIDHSRVGVYGWSFGGYFSALAALARPDIYKVAVAGAPPADWRDYDTAYAERYLGLPDRDAAAYDAASLLEYARRRAPGEARPMLIVHGTSDDNVWFLNSLKLADALERGGRTVSRRSPSPFLPSNELLWPPRCVRNDIASPFSGSGPWVFATFAFSPAWPIASNSWARTSCTGMRNARRRSVC